MRKIEIEMRDLYHDQFEVRWWDADDAFITKREKGRDAAVIACDWDEARQLRDALSKFLEERAMVVAE
jgi:hypothetical protein